MDIIFLITTCWDNINGHWEPKLTYHTTNSLNKTFADVKSGYSNPKFKGLRIFSSW